MKESKLNPKSLIDVGNLRILQYGRLDQKACARTRDHIVEPVEVKYQKLISLLYCHLLTFVIFVHWPEPV